MRAPKHHYMGVSKNRGTPKSSILIGFSIIFTIHFGFFSPYFWVDTHICYQDIYIILVPTLHPESLDRHLSSWRVSSYETDVRHVDIPWISRWSAGEWTELLVPWILVTIDELCFFLKKITIIIMNYNG